MTVDVTVLTSAIAERADNGMLAEAIASVAAQTVTPAAHLITVDHARIGNCRTLNDLSEYVDTVWLAILADDDWFFPEHLEVQYAATDAAPEPVSVVYSYCHFYGWPEGHGSVRAINRPFDPDALREANYIPGGCALVRTDAFREAGGYSDDRHLGDWHLWLKLLDLGARFLCVPEVTWAYRYHGANKQAEFA